MSAESHPAAPGANHARRFTLIWLIATLIATPLVIFVLGPELPPGHGSDVATGQVTDNTVLLAMATPVLLLVVIYLVYAVIVFRQPPGAALEGPAVRGDAKIQTTWIVITSILVLSLAAYGTVRLEQGYGAGSGSGPKPLTVPSGPKLEVQVIAQQWAFTYRYPSYGGVETTHLVLPVNQTVELHVTSLDVIHSFWAYQLGVKADANPGVDNVAFLKTKSPQSFHIHCAELCGLWHGYMFSTGHVVPPAEFTGWVNKQKQLFASVAQYMPPYAKEYYPDPQRRAG